ncbi:MAG: metal ABC transporter solute-binding protein, Zn/Mn family [Geminicoccaceae bacterium]
MKRGRPPPRAHRYDAFGYFAESYGLTFVAPQGVGTESEASAADVTTLIRRILDERISAVFIENVAAYVSSCRSPARPRPLSAARSMGRDDLPSILPQGSEQLTDVLVERCDLVTIALAMSPRIEKLAIASRLGRDGRSSV